MSRGLFIFTYFLVHRYDCLIWGLESRRITVTRINSVCFGMYYIIFFIVPRNDYLRLDLEEFFQQIHIRRLLYAKHRKDPSMESRPEYTPPGHEELSNISLIHQEIFNKPQCMPSIVLEIY